MKSTKIAAILLIFTLLLPLGVHAANYNVTTTNDSGPGSLRQAIIDANASPEDDTILLPIGVYTLSSGVLEIEASGGVLQIEGLGNAAVETTIDADGNSRVFKILSGAELVIENLTITGGQAPDAETNGVGGDGGGILNSGTLTIRDSVVTGNRSGDGGAFNFSLFRGGHGGGIFVVDGSSLTIERSVISDNEAGAGADSAQPGSGVAPGGDGGGVYLGLTTTVSITETTFSGNRAGLGGGGGTNPNIVSGGKGGGGGAIFSLSDDLFVGQSVFVDNQAGDGPSGDIRGHGGNGGAILNSGSLEMVNCTMTGNRCGAGGDGPAFSFTVPNGGHGGAVANAGDVTLIHCTIYGNQTGSGGTHPSIPAYNGESGNGGGIWIDTIDDTLNLENTIVAGNTNESGAEENIHNDNSGPVNQTGTNFIDGDPQLGSLAANGGATQSMLPLTDSPVINGASVTAQTPASDQRGFDRISGSLPDIGAVEAVTFFEVTGNEDVIATIGTTETLTLTFINDSGNPLTVTNTTISGSAAFTVQTPLPSTMAVDEVANLVIAYQPLSFTIDSSTLTISTNEGNYSADLRGIARLASLPNVSTTADDGSSTSLRGVIQTANLNPGSDTISLPTGTYQLTIGDALQISTESLVITGEGSTPDETVIDAGGNSRVLEVLAGTELQLENVTITGGRAPDTESHGIGGAGGGILNAGSLTILDSVITGNRAGDGGYDVVGSRGGRGGGVFVEIGGSLTIERSTFSQNIAGSGSSETGGTGGSSLIYSDGGDGGAIYISQGTTAVITQSTFSENQAGVPAPGFSSIGGSVFSRGSGGGGGAIASRTEDMTIDSCTFANNRAGDGSNGTGLGSGGNGGAILNFGIFYIINSTLTGNRSGDGGSAALILNTYPVPGGSAGHGGAIANERFAVVIHCTITGNQAGSGGPGSPEHTINFGNPVTIPAGDAGADGNGGGFWMAAFGDQLNLENSILAGNTDASDTEDNLDRNNGRFVEFGVNIRTGDPLLEALSDNGGGIETMFPQGDSPAINAATSTGNSPSTDQRGRIRTFGAGPDIGAVESLKITGVVATGTLDGISISWDPATGADSVRVFRLDEFGDPVDVGGAAVDAADWQDTYPVQGQDHTYFVRAVFDGIEGPQSESVTGQRALSAPTLDAPTNSDSGVTLNWSSPDWVESATVFRSTSNDSGTATEIATGLARPPGGQFSFEDTTGTPGQAYYYFARFTANGSHGPLSGGMMGQRLHASTDSLSATNGNFDDRIRIEWNPVTGAVEYILYRNTTASADGNEVEVIRLVSGTTSYSDLGTLPGGLHYYAIKAVMPGNQESAFSDWIGGERNENTTHQPDLLIGKTWSSLRGDGIYNATGAGQKVRLRHPKKRKTFRYVIRVQNDGLSQDELQFRGNRGSRKFRTNFYHLAGDRVNVTGAVVAGTLRQDLAGGGSVAMQVKSRRKGKASNKFKQNNFNLSASSSGVSTRRDLVRGNVKSL